MYSEGYCTWSVCVWLCVKRTVERNGPDRFTPFLGKRCRRATQMEQTVFRTFLDAYRKYVQKAGEPENDAGFLKHNSQLNCYSYPSRPRLVVTRLHIYGLSVVLTLIYTCP